MPSIGSFDYPDTTVEDAVELAKKIAQQFKSAEFDRQALAAALGYSKPNTGAFNQRLADLRRFGIVEGRGDSIRATELARTLAAPGPGEYEQALADVMFKIPLYKALHEHYQGASPSEEDFFATLLNLTKADRMEVQKQVSRIRNLFVAATSRITGAGGSGFRAPQSLPSSEARQHPVSQQVAPFPHGGQAAPASLPGRKTYSSDDGSSFVAVQNNAEAIEELIDILTVWKKRAPPTVPHPKESMERQEEDLIQR